MRKNAMGTRRFAAMLLAAPLVVVSGCAGTPEIPPETQAVRDYVEVGELETVAEIRTRDTDTWSPATEYYAVYKGRDGQFLLEFTRICRALTDNLKITPDRRYDHDAIRGGFDTLRGCRIGNIYPLTEAQVQEIEALTKTADDGN